MDPLYKSSTQSNLYEWKEAAKSKKSPQFIKEKFTSWGNDYTLGDREIKAIRKTLIEDRQAKLGNNIINRFAMTILLKLTGSTRTYNKTKKLLKDAELNLNISKIKKMIMNEPEKNKTLSKLISNKKFQAEAKQIVKSLSELEGNPQKILIEASKLMGKFSKEWVPKEAGGGEALEFLEALHLSGDEYLSKWFKVFEKIKMSDVDALEGNIQVSYANLQVLHAHLTTIRNDPV